MHFNIDKKSDLNCADTSLLLTPQPCPVLSSHICPAAVISAVFCVLCPAWDQMHSGEGMRATTASSSSLLHAQNLTAPPDRQGCLCCSVLC